MQIKVRTLWGSLTFLLVFYWPMKYKGWQPSIWRNLFTWRAKFLLVAWSFWEWGKWSSKNQWLSPILWPSRQWILAHKHYLLEWDSEISFVVCEKQVQGQICEKSVVRVLQYITLKWSQVTQSCPTLCNPVDCSPPGSSIHGVLQARILEWVAISFSNISPYIFLICALTCNKYENISCSVVSDSLQPYGL